MHQMPYSYQTAYNLDYSIHTYCGEHYYQLRQHRMALEGVMNNL